MWGIRRFSSVSLAAALAVLAGLCACTMEPVGAIGAKKEASAGTQPDIAPRNLSEDEARGGHTLARHVGKSDDELRARLERERIAAASTYTDLRTAEETVGTALNHEAERVRNWSQRRGRRPNLAIDFVGEDDRPLGRTLRRGEKSARSCANAVVVLKSDGSNGYYVLTSYPECH